MDRPLTPHLIALAACLAWSTGHGAVPGSSGVLVPVCSAAGVITYVPIDLPADPQPDPAGPCHAPCRAEEQRTGPG